MENPCGRRRKFESLFLKCFIERETIMKFVRISDFNAFIDTVDECKGQVWLESHYGDKFNLKSLFSRRFVTGKLLSEHGDELELFCQLPEDEQLFYGYFNEHPGVV